MSAPTEFFFAPARRADGGVLAGPWAVVGWWEARRPMYNACVGVAGLVSLAAAYGFGALPPYPAVVRIPWQLIVLYAVMANLAYSAGPLADLWARRVGGARWAVVGPALFRYGFVFAVGLTLLPTVAAAGSWGVRILIALGR